MAMSTVPPDDDDAFRWEGDEDERATRTRRRRAKAGSEQATAVSPDAAAVDETVGDELVETVDDDLVDDDLDDDRPVISSLGIVVLGIFGGIALLETIGWVRGDLRLPFTTDVATGIAITTVLPFIIEILGRIAAVVAAPLWFAIVLWRIPAGPRRVLWLLIGAFLLVPWPVVVSAS
jgi:hypothetical protein